MNTIGKVFVMVILIMSLVLWGWRWGVSRKKLAVLSETLSSQLTKAKADQAELISAHHRVEKLDREKTARSNRLFSSKPKKSPWTNRISRSKPS